MYKNETTLEISKSTSNDALINQANQIIKHAAEKQQAKIVDIQKVKFTYPKNGLYGLL